MDNTGPIAIQIRTFDHFEDEQPSGLIELPRSKHSRYKGVAQAFLAKYPNGAVDLDMRYPFRTLRRWYGSTAAAEVGRRNVARWEAERVG